MTTSEIAKVCHEANRALCEIIGDAAVPWAEAPGWQRSSAINGVKHRIENKHCSPESMHESWMKEKLLDGWKYGSVKDAEKKEHPCLLPYSSLPAEQKAKDALFSAIVDALYDEDEHEEDTE